MDPLHCHAMGLDIFPGYTQQKFEREFQKTFTIETSSPIPESERVLYLMKKK